MAEPSECRILSEKALHHAADPALLAYCPSMDLVALVTTDQQVLIYRLNGQRVYGATQKSDNLRVASIRWKPNGELLAIAWSDGSVRLVGSESSKVVHHFSTGTEVSGITCMGWSTNTTNRSTSAVKQENDAASWTSLLPAGKYHDVLDLPRDLSLIDIETSLPKLSVLTAGGSDEVFSSRASVDALFQPFDPRDNNAVDVMVVGTREGTIHLSIYDSFVIGSFELPGRDSPELIHHASHKQYSTHSLLLRASASGKQLYFLPMDLRFISASSEYLSLLASRSTALQNLLRYINQVQEQMIAEWKSTQELPGRFLSSINETLKKDNRDIVQALYHSVATGHTLPPVREWLVDELSERGHKRWDKAVTTGLENLRRLVHENMLPAIERCSLILSRFVGIAKFHGANSALGFTTQQINTIMDSVACLHLVSSKILVQVVDELEHFTTFSSWLRYDIDRLASDVSTSATDDSVAEKEASLDHSKVLSYIQTAMTSSPLAVFLGTSTEEFHDDWSHGEHGMPMYDLLEKQLHEQERGHTYIEALPRVGNLCQVLTRQASAVFSQIAEAEKRNVLFGKMYEIGSVDREAPMHMRIISQNQSAFETYVVFSATNILQIIRVTLSVENGISALQNVDSACLQLGNGLVKDLKIGDDNAVFVLWESGGTTSLLNICYREHAEARKSHLQYGPHSPTGKGTTPIMLSDADVLRRFSRHEFGNDGSFVPEKLEIREGSATAESRRILLLSQDRQHFRVLEWTAKAGPLSDADADAEDAPMV